MITKPQLNLFCCNEAEEDYQTAEYLAYQMLQFKTQTLQAKYLTITLK